MKNLHGGNPPALDHEFRCKLGQTASQRFVTAGFFGALVLVPLLLVLRTATAPDNVGLDTLWEADRWWGIYRSTTFVSTNDVAIAVGVALPLAAGMITASWSSPPVRGHILVQLALGSAVAVGLVFAPTQAALGALAVAGGLCLASMHAFFGSRVLGRVSIRKGKRKSLKSPITEGNA